MDPQFLELVESIFVNVARGLGDVGVELIHLRNADGVCLGRVVGY